MGDHSLVTCLDPDLNPNPEVTSKCIIHYAIQALKCVIMRLKPQQILYVYNVFQNNTTLLEDESQTVEEAGIEDGQQVLIEGIVKYI